MKEKFPPTIKKGAKRAGLFVGGGIAALTIACGGGKAINSEVQSPQSSLTPPAPTETLKPVPTEVPTLVLPSPTIEQPTPVPPTPEVKQEVPCQILPPEYCSQAELINWTYQGVLYKIVGFRNLPPGTPIFSPIDGSLAKAQENGEPFNGLLAQILDPSDPSLSFTFIGDLEFDDMLSSNVKKGDIIGYIGNTGASNLNGYNLIFEVERFDPSTQRFFNPDDVIEQLFPGLLSKPANSTTFSGETKLTGNSVYDQSPPQ